jgi:hypothetical protein
MRIVGILVAVSFCICAAVAEVKLLQRFLPRLFTRPMPAQCEVVLWWELRRIPFNLLIGVYGIFCLVAAYWGIETSGELRPGEDAVEPLALLAVPFVVNACYTLGWIVELLVGSSPQLGPLLLRLGLGFSLFVISAPAVFWAGIGVLQCVH